MLEMDIKIKMMDARNEFWLLFFEEKIELLTKEYERKKAYEDDIKYSEEDIIMRLAIKHLN
jgi:hypothetical protein